MNKLELKFEADGIPFELLPRAQGFRILIAPVKIEEKSKGGIVLTGESQKSLEYFRDIGKVLYVGNDCYKNTHFQHGIPLSEKEPKPWCKVGDIVFYSAYTGKDIVITHNNVDAKLKFVNDDEVLAVIDDLSILSFL